MLRSYIPKNGTAWTRELVWLLQNDCNFEDAKTIPINKRFPFLDGPTLIDFMKEELPIFMQGGIFKLMEDMPSPKLIKSHLCLLPDGLMEKSEIVTSLKNPKGTESNLILHHENQIHI